jgi:ABC-type nitrate/sulfonate/bicarbonate transport system substrate-binding protein
MEDLQMKNRYIKQIVIILAVAMLIGIMAGCAEKAVEEAPAEQAQMEDITVLLDWVPNTNHTGLYVALENGYYAEEGLNVEIIQPSEGGSADLIAAGQGQFGVSYQEQVTYARTAETPLPIKAIAAIIQHNTSGFASPADRNIESAADFEGKKYGGWGSPMEIATLKALMEKEGADFEKLEVVDIGSVDFFGAVETMVDFTWIYNGWDGVAAGLKDYPINFIKLQDVDPNLDFYTPVLIAEESYLEANPETAKAFMRATRKGYEFAIENPAEAAEKLLIHAGEIDPDLAAASQEYLAGEYQAEASVWGTMKAETWENYSNWMYERGLIESKLDVEKAFTNEFIEE